MQSRKRYILYKTFMLLGISDRAKLGVGGKCKKNKYKMQECTPGNATCCAESWINPQSTCCSTSAGAERIEQKRGSVGNANAGTKSKCVALQNWCVEFPPPRIRFWFVSCQMFDSITSWLNFCVCIFSQKLRTFLITKSKGLDFPQFWLKPL